ncbi:transposase [Nocardia kruczakiae]|uniref:transposase n=1 Tax=Nocardia kruczakiae TaxID=261477 RepID=UPI0014289F37|nr:transposase [Nocardia kruczakiae]
MHQRSCFGGSTLFPASAPSKSRKHCHFPPRVTVWTAPLDASSGQQQRHRLSRAGKRKINRVLHIMAIVQLRHQTAGRVYYDGKRAAGKTSMESMRALKRRLSNVAYNRMLADQRRRDAAGPGGHSGTTTYSSVTGTTPHTDPSDKPQPGPTDNQPNAELPTAS